MSVKHYDLEQGQGYGSGGAYMREETNGGDYVRSEDYAALEKLCQQQHEALEIANGLHPCPLYSDAVTAYAALFPKTGGAK